jgi:hypothetical protein
MTQLSTFGSSSAPTTPVAIADRLIRNC